ncbi:hypothetical protein FQN60_003263 [Xyrichtys novacula]|uniref:Uncharacterized protein n=1 Tax=Xyrichtys novacula TaxID=13765 RepID=A0AAV1H4H3_XYRNO|nr:hypothetical protein FQN60_003263 [Xyrichtys novacula]
MFILISVCGLTPSSTDMGLGSGRIGGCSGEITETKVAEMGKHSWGHIALVGLQLSGPFHTFISVFAQGMDPNLHTLISVRSLYRGPASWDESDPGYRHRRVKSSTAKLACSSLNKGL